jgi:hypothetical protein
MHSDHAHFLQDRSDWTRLSAVVAPDQLVVA